MNIRKRVKQLIQLAKKEAVVGACLIAPFIIMVWAVYSVIQAIYDGIIFPVLSWLFGEQGMATLVANPFLRTIIAKGLLPILAVSLAFIVCVLASRVARHRSLQFLYKASDALAASIPGAGSIYVPIRQIAHSIIKTLAAKEFDRVVLIKAAQPGAFILGFVTKEVSRGKKKITVVFTGFSPIPTQGPTLFVTDQSILIETGVDVQLAISAIISMGISAGDEIMNAIFDYMDAQESGRQESGAQALATLITSPESGILPDYII